MRTSRWRFAQCVSLSLIVMVSLGALVFGQESTGNIYGRVVDEQGSSIPGATATLTGETAPRSTTSDANGYFRFLYVAPGRYTVTVTMPGFATLERENVIVTLGRNTDVEMPLRLSGVEETVRVISATPLIDSRKVQTGITFSNVELREIPTSRDIYSLMQQVPGVQLDQVNVAGAASGRVGGPDFTTKGSGGVTYLVDGATVTDNSYGTFNGGQARQNGGNATFFDFESFEEVDVATGGSLVDLQTPGVTINIVTKRGTNELKGSARFFYASDDWQANNLSDEAIEQGFETNSTRFVREYGAEVGGPIIKDRLWIWGSGARQDISLNLTGNDAEGNPIRTTARIVPFTAKLSAQLAASNSMSLFYQRGDRFEGNTGKDSDRGADTLRNLTIESDFYKLEDDHVFSPDLIASVYVSHMRPTYEHVPVSGTAAQAVFYDDIWHGSWLTYTTKNHQYQGNATVSKFFNTGSVNHELKFGFNYRRQVNDSASAWPGDQIFGSEFSTYALAGVTRGVRAIYKVNYYTGTLSDTLTFGNLTVNGGLRYDVQRGQNLPSSAPANPTFPELLPAIEYHGEEEPSFEYEDLQPRLSATYALGKNKSTLLRASYARYADQLGFLPFQLNGLPITSGFYYYWTDTDRDHHVDPGEIDFGSGVVSFYNVDPTTAPITPNAVDPGLTTPKTDELTFGVDQQIFTDFAVSATYTYRKAKHLQYRLPIGAGPDTWTLRGIARGTVTAANGFTLTFEEPFYRLVLPEAPTGDLFRNRPGASQTYHGVELTAVKRLTNRWMLRASAGWNDWTQDVPDEAILDPNNRWALGGQNDDGGTVVGYSGKDTVWVNSRWQFNVTALYQLPWDINVSANFFGREGFPQTYYIRSQQFDIDGSRTQNLVDKIDSYRLDDVYELDLRFEKTFALGPVNISPAVEVFNVTNEDTVLQRANRVGNYNFNTNAFVRNTLFNTIVETQSPRIVRVGARVSF